MLYLLMGMTKNHNNPLGEKITIAILKNRLSFFYTLEQKAYERAGTD